MRCPFALLMACLAVAAGCQSGQRPHKVAKPTLPSPWQTIQEAEAAELAAAEASSVR